MTYDPQSIRDPKTGKYLSRAERERIYRAEQPSTPAERDPIYSLPFDQRQQLRRRAEQDAQMAAQRHAAETATVVVNPYSADLKRLQERLTFATPGERAGIEARIRMYAQKNVEFQKQQEAKQRREETLMHEAVQNARVYATSFSRTPPHESVRHEALQASLWLEAAVDGGLPPEEIAKQYFERVSEINEKAYALLDAELASKLSVADASVREVQQLQQRLESLTQTDEHPDASGRTMQPDSTTDDTPQTDAS